MHENIRSRWSISLVSSSELRMGNDLVMTFSDTSSKRRYLHLSQIWVDMKRHLKNSRPWSVRYWPISVRDSSGHTNTVMRYSRLTIVSISHHSDQSCFVWPQSQFIAHEYCLRSSSSSSLTNTIWSMISIYRQNISKHSSPTVYAISMRHDLSRCQKKVSWHHRMSYLLPPIMALIHDVLLWDVWSMTMKSLTWHYLIPSIRIEYFMWRSLIWPRLWDHGSSNNDISKIWHHLVRKYDRSEILRSADWQMSFLEAMIKQKIDTGVSWRNKIISENLKKRVSSTVMSSKSWVIIQGLMINLYCIPCNNG